MNYLLNFNKHFAIPAFFVLVANFNAQAQNPVESTHVDEKYAYTTVVYKNTAASDKDVLSSLENDFSVGDVVRVTFAPAPAPIAASEPVYADKGKGEDAWMSAPAKSVGNLTASTNPNHAPNTVINTIATSPKPAPIAAKALAPKAFAVAKPVETAAIKINKAVEAVPAQEQKAEVTPVATTSKPVSKMKSASSEKSAKAHKSVKKSGKKSGLKLKLKNRKHSKQRYSCPKF